MSLGSVTTGILESFAPDGAIAITAGVAEAAVQLIADINLE